MVNLNPNYNPSNNENNKGFIGKHPIIANSVIIILIAILGLWIVYISLALFTKHGQNDTVPSVENMSYTKAVNLLHEHGFNVDIRDSLYKDNVKPGMVIEQFPKANSLVKPGRKIFLYINAVHPKEVVIDDNHNSHEYALRGVSYRQGLARLEELGFKNIKVIKVLGENDRIVKITANGVVVRNMQKIPVNARIIMEISDGRLQSLRDSLYNLEQYRELHGQENGSDLQDPYYQEGTGNDPIHYTEPEENQSNQEQETQEEALEFF